MTAPSINFTAGGIYGVPLMKFALTFDGELRANGNIKAKWNIRKEFHPQLAELWRLHPATQAIMRRPLVPQHSPYMPMVRHHSVDPIPQNVVPTPNIDLCEVVGVGGQNFYLSYVRKSAFGAASTFSFCARKNQAASTKAVTWIIVSRRYSTRWAYRIRSKLLTIRRLMIQSIVWSRTMH